MTTNWQPEADEVQEEQPKTLDYLIKAQLALEDSDKHTWGIIKDTEDNLLWKPGDGVIVGKWSRSPHDGLIHISLETAIDALVDKAVQHFAELAEQRREAGPTKTSRTRGARAPKAPPEPPEELAVISALRDKFKK